MVLKNQEILPVGHKKSTCFITGRQPSETGAFNTAEGHPSLLSIPYSGKKIKSGWSSKTRRTVWS